MPETNSQRTKRLKRQLKRTAAKLRAKKKSEAYRERVGEIMREMMDETPIGEAAQAILNEQQTELYPLLQMQNSEEQEKCWMHKSHDNEVLKELRQKQDYAELERVLKTAYNQAAIGKGKLRHANNEPFERQAICQICRDCGIGFATGQAIKKTKESHRLDPDSAIRELLGAINYLAAAVIVIEEQMGD